MKKTLAILLALVLCLGVCALVACDNGDNANVPVAEGKVTLYFELAENSVKIPSYASVFFAGGQTAEADGTWPTNLAAPEFKNVEGTNLYYIQIEYNPDAATPTEYQLVLGYNKSSGLPDDKCGLIWKDQFKSDECAQYAYGTNKTFEYKAGAQKISLGTHTFSTEIEEPVSVNTELRITFAQGLGENAEVYFMGDFSGWDAAKAKATANADRTVYSLALTDVLCSNYSFKILVIGDKTAATTTKDGADLGIWDWNMTEPEFPAGVGNADSVMRAYIEISGANGANLAMSILESDGGSYIDLLDTISVTDASRDEVKTGLNLAQIDLVEGKDGDNGNNIFTWKYQMEVAEKTFVVKFKDALSADAILFMMGSITDPAWSNANDQSKMTIAEDRKSASLSLVVLPGDYEYKIVVFHKDAFAGDVWSGGIEINDNGGNLKVTVEGFDEETIDLFAAAIDTPVVKAPGIDADVTFKITFVADMTGKIVKVKGPAVGGWGEELTMTTTDGRTFTVTVAKEKLNAGEGEFIVGVGDATTTDFYADGHKVAGTGQWGGANAKVTIPQAGGEVALFAAPIPAYVPAA